MGLRARNLNEIAPSDHVRCGSTPLLGARGISATRNGKSILRDVTTTMRAGETNALVGRNGAGKTTLCRTLCGFERVKQGSLALEGRPTTRKACLRASSMMFQDVNFQLFAENVAEEVTFGLSRRAARHVDVAGILSDLALEGLEDRHPATLSGGEKQRLALAACIAAGKRILVFDEPTSGLDLDGVRRIAQLLERLADQGRTVLVVTHDLELVASCCNRALLVENGTVKGEVMIAERFDRVRKMMGANALG